MTNSETKVIPCRIVCRTEFWFRPLWHIGEGLEPATIVTEMEQVDDHQFTLCKLHFKGKRLGIYRVGTGLEGRVIKLFTLEVGREFCNAAYYTDILTAEGRKESDLKYLGEYAAGKYQHGG